MTYKWIAALVAAGWMTSMASGPIHAQQTEDDFGWDLPDDIKKAPIHKFDTTISDAVFNSVWQCISDPPGDEVGVKTVMTVRKDKTWPAIVIETNFIPNNPKPVEVDMIYGMQVTQLKDGKLKLTSKISTMGAVRNWPDGVKMNKPDSVEMEVTAISKTKMTGWSRSFGITSTMDCKAKMAH